MPVPSFLRRSKPSFDQLDLFSSFTVPAPEPVEIIVEPTLVQPIALATIQPERPTSTDSTEQATIPECDHFIVDLPEPVRTSRDFRITDEHRIGAGGLAEKARDNLAAIRVLKAIEAEEREASDDEKVTLARYVGWGAMARVFDRWQPDHLIRTADAVKELLTPEEYASAKASTPNAHYTSPMVIKAVWDGLRQIGVGSGAQILEPAMGVGHFFGLMPDDMQGGQRTGVELDSITARIAKHLYPEATIFAKGFEETPLPDKYFSVVVGNVPFGDYAVHDPAMKADPTRVGEQAVGDELLAQRIYAHMPLLEANWNDLDKPTPISWHDALANYEAIASRVDLCRAIAADVTQQLAARAEVTARDALLKQMAESLKRIALGQVSCAAEAQQVAEIAYCAYSAMVEGPTASQQKEQADG